MKHRTRRAAVQTVLLFAWALLSPGLLAEDDGDLGRKVFLEIAQPTCATCHALEDAGSAGSIGPSLDELKPDAARVEAAVRNGLGVMPAFEGKLTDEQIKAVATYVARATGAAE